MKPDDVEFIATIIAPLALTIVISKDLPNPLTGYASEERDIEKT